MLSQHSAQEDAGTSIWSWWGWAALQKQLLQSGRTETKAAGRPEEGEEDQGAPGCDDRTHCRLGVRAEAIAKG